MKKENLLSIGALSKQTGVHIKSLRYYDSLGILRPAYVDPSSGYRYYSLQQIPVVDAIQLCIDLDIPLKQFTDYCMDGGSRIHYGKLVERGTILAKEKIQAIQERLTRACLKIVIIPKRWLFFRHTLPIFLGIHQVFLRQIGFVWRKNPSPLGTFPIFKQRLSWKKCRLKSNAASWFKKAILWCGAATPL